jgi:regulator of protease activity HflC (stomatin/prohibitin superfamily)
MVTQIVIFVLVVALIAGFVYLSVRIVREYERLVVFRLGRCIGERGPGLVLLIPIADRAVRIDLREQFLQIPHQTCITKDNAPIAIDFITFYRVLDPVASVTKVGDFQGAAQNLAATTQRSVIGDISLDDVLAKRDEINTALRIKLDEVTERWGVQVTNVEIREIIPPPGVQEAMTRQMSAERSRRAVVTEAEGQKQAAVTVAEGQKQAAILQAEGERQAAILTAEGFSTALRTVHKAAEEIDPKTMGIHYLETLKAIGASPSTKFVVPLELTSLLRGLGGMTEKAFDGQGTEVEAKRPQATPGS